MLHFQGAERCHREHFESLFGREPLHQQGSPRNLIRGSHASVPTVVPGHSPSTDGDPPAEPHPTRQRIRSVQLGPGRIRGAHVRLLIDLKYKLGSSRPLHEQVLRGEHRQADVVPGDAIRQQLIRATPRPEQTAVVARQWRLPGKQRVQPPGRIGRRVAISAAR